MIQKAETGEPAADTFALTTESDFDRLFADGEITFSLAVRIRRWVCHSDRERTAFVRKLEANPAAGIKGTDRKAERMGLGWWILGDYEKAGKELAKAKTDLSLACSSVIIKEQKGVRQAIAFLEKALGESDAGCMVHAMLLINLHDVGRSEEGVKSASFLEKKGGDNLYALKARALFLEDNGGAQEAVRLFQAVLDKDPGDEDALFHFARLLDMHGLDAEAQPYYERAAELFPAHINAVLNLGQVYYENDENEQASFCFKRVLKSRPDHAMALRYLKDIGATENMYYDEKKAKKVEELNKILHIPVTDFELSVRSRNCLSRMNIRSLGDLIQKTEADLLSYKNFGETSLAEIKRMLASKNLYLGQAKDIANEELKEKQKRQMVDVSNSELLSKNIDDLELSVRAGKCLQKMGVISFGDLIRMSDATLLKMRNFGQTSLNEIKQKLATYGLALSSD